MRTIITFSIALLFTSCTTLKAPEGNKSVVVAYWSDSIIVIDKDLAKRLDLPQGYTIKDQTELRAFLRAAAMKNKE